MIEIYEENDSKILKSKSIIPTELLVAFIINGIILYILFSYGNHYVLFYFIISFLFSVSKKTPFDFNLIFIFITSPLIIIFEIYHLICRKKYNIK